MNSVDQQNADIRRSFSVYSVQIFKHFIFMSRLRVRVKETERIVSEYISLIFVIGVYLYAKNKPLFNTFSTNRMNRFSVLPRDRNIEAYILYGYTIYILAVSRMFSSDSDRAIWYDWILKMAFLRETKFKRLSPELKARIMSLHLDTENIFTTSEIAALCQTTVSIFYHPHRPLHGKFQSIYFAIACPNMNWI